jgi:hypothetical protein
MFVIRSIDTKVILSVDEMQYENRNTEGFWRILRELLIFVQVAKLWAML